LLLITMRLGSFLSYLDRFLSAWLPFCSFLLEPQRNNRKKMKWYDGKTKITI
jgi:hypothetical protein